MNEKLIAEAGAFDSQIEDRIKNGHVPDIRYTIKNDYFYNNVWRRPEYVNLDFGEIFRLIKDSIDSIFSNQKVNVLEVGCGPGFITLELARAGYSTTGIDLSSECIKVAREFADRDPHKTERGRLEYFSGDFFSLKDIGQEKFDVIVFVGALHHFANQDEVMKRVKQLLKKDGVIIVHEPTRDRVTLRNAAVVNLIKVLLSVNQNYFEEFGIPQDSDAIRAEAEKTFSKMRYETESGAKAQSVNDNEAGYEQMYPALKNNFEQIEFSNRYAFFHELIGGLRYNEETNFKMAKYLKEIDTYFCQLGIIDYTEFYFTGRYHE